MPISRLCLNGMSSNIADTMKYTLLYLSGGSGTRMQNKVPKQYLMLGGKPVIMHILDRVEQIECITDIVIVCAPEYEGYIQSLLEQYGISKPVRFAPAGATRQQSVSNGLSLIDSDDIILHESARPFVKKEDFERLIAAPNRNATYGLAIPFSVVKGYTKYEEILDRSSLVNIQLPQKFETRLLKEAHRKARLEGKEFTEDGSMVFHYFPDTFMEICPGLDYDIKLTTNIDMIAGEKIYDAVFERKQ